MLFKMGSKESDFDYREEKHLAHFCLLFGFKWVWVFTVRYIAFALWKGQIILEQKQEVLQAAGWTPLDGTVTGSQGEG